MCDPAFNAVKTIELAGVAQEKKAILAVFPEPEFLGYSCGDLFFQDAAALDARRNQAVADATALTDAAVIVGAPLKVRDALFNCAVVLCGGKTAFGIAVKSFPANYREFYELRHFRPARELPVDSIDLVRTEKHSDRRRPPV